MGQRLELQQLLLTIVPNVYYQPPESLKMQYPCIVYSRDDEQTFYADGIPYVRRKGYQITVMDQDPESVIADEVANLPTARFDRSFTANQLNHNVYNLFF